MSSPLPSLGMEVDANPYTSQQQQQQQQQRGGQHGGARPRHVRSGAFSGGQETSRQAARPSQSGSQTRVTQGQATSSTRPSSSQSRKQDSKRGSGPSSHRPPRSMDSGCPPTDSVVFGHVKDEGISTDALASYASTSTCGSESTTSEVLRDVKVCVQKTVHEKLDRSISTCSGVSTSTIGSSQPASLSSMSSDQGQGEDLVPMSQELQQFHSEMPPKLKTPYYDAIIICAEEDEEAVRRFRDRVKQSVKLYDRYKPEVILYEEFDLPGKSKFKVLDSALERSTYVFLFVTKCFCEDTWAEHLSDSCLMEAINNPDKQWCVVPIFTTSKKNSEFKIPVSLNSLKGVQYWTKDDSYFLEAVQRLLQDKISIRRQKEEALAREREAWLIDFKVKERMRRAEYERALEEKRAEAEKTLAAFHSSQSVPAFSQEDYSKSQDSSEMHSSSSLPSMQNPSIHDLGAAGGCFAGALPHVAGLNRSDSQSTTSLHSSMSSLGSSILPGADPTRVQPPSFHSLPHNPAPRSSVPGPLSLPIPEGGDMPQSLDRSHRVMENVQQQQQEGNDLTEDSPASLLGGRVPNSTGSTAGQSSVGSSVDPPSMSPSSSTSSQQGPGLCMAGTPPRNIPGQVPTSQNTPQHSSLPSSFGRTRSGGSGGSSDQDSCPKVRSEIHYHYHYHHPPPAQSRQSPTGQTVVYNIHNAEVVQIGSHNLVQNSSREDPPVFDCETSSSASNVSLSSASSGSTSPQKPASEPKKQPTEGVLGDQGENRLPPQSVISEDNARSVPEPIIPGRRQGHGEEESLEALAERGLMEMPFSSTGGPAALHIRGELNREPATPDTSLKQPRPRSGSSCDETKSSSGAEEKEVPVESIAASPFPGKKEEAKAKATSPPSKKTESSSQAEEKPSPVKPTARAAVVRPLAAAFPQNQPGAVQYKDGKQMVVVQPMVRTPAPDSHQTEVKQPVDVSLTTPKVYYQEEETIPPSDLAQSEKGEKEDEVEEDGENGKGHTASGEEKMTLRNRSEQMPRRDTSPALPCQVALTHPLQGDASSAGGTDVEPTSPECDKASAGTISFREGRDESTADDKDSSTPSLVTRGSDPTLVQSGQRGSGGVEWGPVIYTNSNAGRSGSQQCKRQSHSQAPFDSRSRRSESSPSLRTRVLQAPHQSTSHQSLQGLSPGNSQQQQGEGRGTYPLQSSTRNSWDRDHQSPRGTQDPDSKKNCRIS